MKASSVMKAHKVAWVLTGDGINCEQETAHALTLAGFRTRIWHINDLIAESLPRDVLAQRCSLLALPGGFSFGDDLGSGKVLAIKILHALQWDLNQFANSGGAVLGVCNGFQALLKLGVFGTDVSITHNDHGRFYDGWVETQVNGTRTPWLKGIDRMKLPIRHGEGRVVFAGSTKAVMSSEPMGTDAIDARVCLTYTSDPNGSQYRTAGLTDRTGRILGLMPHPEAYIRASSAPDWTQTHGREPFAEGEGLQMFKNAFQFSREVGESR